MNSGIKVFGRERKLVLVLKKLRVWEVGIPMH